MPTPNVFPSYGRTTYGTHKYGTGTLRQGAEEIEYLLDLHVNRASAYSVDGKINYEVDCDLKRSMDVVTGGRIALGFDLYAKTGLSFSLG